MGPFQVLSRSPLARRSTFGVGLLHILLGVARTAAKLTRKKLLHLFARYCAGTGLGQIAHGAAKTTEPHTGHGNTQPGTALAKQSAFCTVLGSLAHRSPGHIQA